MNTKPAAYFSGYEDKVEEINGMGWTAARDAFNVANPPGQPWTGSVDGLAYAQGEFAALHDNLNKQAA